MDDASHAQSPSEAVVSTVAEMTDQSPLEMEPIAEVIDPDALDTLIGRDEETEQSVSISFTYSGCRVHVTADGVQLDREE